MQVKFRNCSKCRKLHNIASEISHKHSNYLSNAVYAKDIRITKHGKFKYFKRIDNQ